ncbi:MAG TPA: sulfotransferase [Azonexus sp.]|nr:sulfotransferase [Azonexus sp.]
MPKLRNLHKLLDPEIRQKNLRELRYQLRGLWWDATRPAVPDPVFVVGCSRSGTTVTYETLATAPQFLSFGWEIPQFWNSLYGPLENDWHSEAAGAEHARPEHRDAALRYFYQRLGAGWVLDKTCINVMRIPYLHQLFPQAKFVFIQRDGRDNISSMMDGWRMGRTDGRFELSQFFGPFPEPVAINGGEFKEWSFFLAPGWREYNHASLEEVCAFQWIAANRMALDAKSIIPPTQWIHLRYEDLFERPVGMFREAFAQLGVPFTPELEARCANLQPTSVVKGTPKKQKWREHNPAAIERILPMITPMLRELGYDAED